MSRSLAVQEKTPRVSIRVFAIRLTSGGNEKYVRETIVSEDRKQSLELGDKPSLFVLGLLRTIRQQAHG